MDKKSKSPAKALTIFKSKEKKVFITNSANETRTLGTFFAALLKKGDIVFFTGDLGSGKTTFIQGIIGNFVQKKYIRSSSFTIASEYEAADFKLFHLDLYRLAPSNIADIGIDDYLYSNNVALIEWAQRLKGSDNEATWIVESKYIDDNKREIVIRCSRDYTRLSLS
ncbi:MAG: tRNA (adenosine(37)-N6)-threonylcarbamoyltransferase complex ATPase subunit type 1 TsaE [Elusimicrobiota bacterium]|jgi:tRNA threonylcarbamoyladenosine biosynthesis protein TsaE|nr:tRNA (adenosine(37)-N6)-threonylcarbamoyltransferase complex ATPase subunit type 1 TsaE [Elusimicrobiota bacterium]